MIFLQSKLDNKNKEVILSNKFKRTISTVSNQRLRNRSRSPIFSCKKGGFSLSKKHSIKFERIYSQKNLFPVGTPQESRYKCDSTKKNNNQQTKSSKSAGLSLHKNKQQKELSTSDRNSSRISIGRLGKNSFDREHIKNHQNNQIQSRKLNMIQQTIENSFQT